MGIQLARDEGLVFEAIVSAQCRCPDAGTLDGVFAPREPLRFVNVSTRTAVAT
jgi:hypothetical protein